MSPYFVIGVKVRSNLHKFIFLYPAPTPAYKVCGGGGGGGGGGVILF